MKLSLFHKRGLRLTTFDKMGLYVILIVIMDFARHDYARVIQNINSLLYQCYFTNCMILKEAAGISSVKSMIVAVNYFMLGQQGGSYP